MSRHQPHQELEVGFDRGAGLAGVVGHELVRPLGLFPGQVPARVNRDSNLVPSVMPICGGVLYQANIEPADQRRSLRLGASHGLRKLVCSRMRFKADEV
jgi:hypothetical protein